MPINFPDLIQHNNSDRALMDVTESRGTAYPLNQLSDTGSIPSDKRKPGMIVFVTGSKEFYGFKGTGSADIDWNTPSNWGTIGGSSTPSNVKSGEVSSYSTTTPYTASVAFGSSFPNSDYSISLTTDIGRILTIENKRPEKFDINTNSSVLPNGKIYWIATAYNN
jgi:hypothetical protein